MTVGLPPQRTCGTMGVHYRLLTTNLAYAMRRQEIENRSLEYARLGIGAARTGITVIPVVVHVLYNASHPEQNISDAQVQSQIDVLNRDFRAKNTDISSVPSVFQPFVADARIEFVLATTDPNGNPTNGITRTVTTVKEFSSDDRIKSSATGGVDAWPTNRYLNLWVAPRLVDPVVGALLGYAQFPGGPAATDGVVIVHTGFGTTGTAAAPFNLGRTATHEIGHWLNLRHIWGDDGNGCNGSDFVNDTPNQAGPNTGRPRFPRVTCNNGPNGDMFMNYMDYTDDAGMFMFTTGQVVRMQAALDNERASIGLTRSDDRLYQLHSGGAIWEYTGTPCSGDNCPGWQKLDNNPATVAIASSGKHLYQLHSGGAIWEYTDTPCTGDSCPGWKKLDNNPATVAIAVSGKHLYQLHSGGAIWEYTGTPCTGDSCPGWRMLDNNPATVAIAAIGARLYQLHSGGAIWEYTGTPCTGDSCPGWRMLDNNPATVAIAVNDDHLYQLHSGGAIWEYTGTPCTGDSCPGWKKLDQNPATVAIAASGKNLYQLHSSGAVWQYTGTPCSEAGCPGWQQLDNNPATVSITAIGSSLYQLHSSGAIWEYTGPACTGDICPGWKKLDNNPATTHLSGSVGVSE